MEPPGTAPGSDPLITCAFMPIVPKDTVNIGAWRRNLKGQSDDPVALFVEDFLTQTSTVPQYHQKDQQSVAAIRVSSVVGQAMIRRLLDNLMTTVRAFRDDIAGGLTVEYVMWVPFMASGVVLTTDVTMLMQEQSRLFVMARDTSRIVALGQKTDVAAVEFMKERLGSHRDYMVAVSVDSQFVTSRVAVPYSDVLIFGGMFTGDNLLAGYSTMLIESVEDQL